jgi:hypothetical protein
MNEYEGQLIKDKKYQGKFVTLNSLTDNSVVAYGDDPFEVSRLSMERGMKEPNIFYVSESNVALMYCVRLPQN